MRQILKLILIISMIILVSACVSYPTVVELPSKSAEMMQNHVAKSGLVAGAEPINDISAQLKLLGEDLSSVGVIPIHILLQNQNDFSIFLKVRDITLRTPDGHVFIAKRYDVVARLFNKKYGRGSDSAASLFGVLGAVAGLSLASQEFKTQDKRGKVFLNKSIQSGEILPGSLISGIVYFAIPTDIKQFTKATLELLTYSSENIEIMLEIPLKEVAWPTYSSI